MKATNDKIKSLMPSLIEQYKAKFSERLRLLLEPKEIDNAKVIQEASVVLEKLDISEEVAQNRKPCPTVDRDPQ